MMTSNQEKNHETTQKERDKTEELDVRILKMIDIRVKQHVAKEAAVCLRAQEKMVKERAKTDIKEMTKQFCSTTTAHGVSRVVDADSKTGKFLWVMILLMCLTVFLYQATVMIKTYFDYPVVVEIKVVENSKLTFPSVTVCNNNRLRASKVLGTRHQALVMLSRDTAVGIASFIPSPTNPGHGVIGNREEGQVGLRSNIYIFESQGDYVQAEIVCRERSMQLCTSSQLKIEARNEHLPAFTDWAFFSHKSLAIQTGSCEKDGGACTDCIAGRFPIKPADQVNQSHAFCCPIIIAMTASVGTISNINGTGSITTVPPNEALEEACNAVTGLRRAKPCTASQLLHLYKDGVRFDKWGWFVSPLQPATQIRLDGSCHDDSSTTCYKDILPVATQLHEAGVFCCSPQVCVQSGCTSKVSSCSNPIGMESGKTWDRQIRASSSDIFFGKGYPHHGRLNALSYWQPRETDLNPRFEVDFERSVILTGVIIQLDSHSSGMDGYMLEYGQNETSWTRYIDEYGGDIHFCGIVDDDYYNIQHLPKATAARRIAILPFFAIHSSYNRFHFRAEFLGCDFADCNVNPRATDLYDVDDLQCSGTECYSNTTAYRGRMNSSSNGTCGNWSCPQSYRGNCRQENFCRVSPDSEVVQLVCPESHQNGTGNNAVTSPCVDIPRCPINEGEDDNTFPTSRTFYQHFFAKQYCNERGKDLCTTDDISLMKLDSRLSSDSGWFADQKRQMNIESGRMVFEETLQAGRAAYCCDKLFRPTDERHISHQIASKACRELGMQLCTIVQLEAAHKVGIRRSKYPEDLAWFSAPDKVALLNETCGCSVGDMCYNRIIPFHRPGRLKSYKALCCQQTLVTTDQKYDTINGARGACLFLGLTLCSLHQVEVVFPGGTERQESGWTEEITIPTIPRPQASRVAHCCRFETLVSFTELFYRSRDVNMFRGCNNPLGMEAGTIAPDQITADAVLSVSNSVENAPAHARLNGMSSWKMVSYDGWIEVDLIQQMLITGIVTQGHGDKYITSFTLTFGSRRFDWEPYEDDLREMHFMGNVDGETPNHVYLPRAVATRYVRLHPKTWNNDPNLRLEIIGCKRYNCEILSNVGADSFPPSAIKCWEKECIVGTGLNYRGFQNVTNSGRNCQKWDSHDPHVHCTTPALFPNAGLVENYCRNIPGSLAKVPWCFTNDPKRPREFCPVEMCDVGCIDSGLATVANDDDWFGFIQNSQTDDFSDITDISTASKDEIAEIGHQKEDFILQCTFDKKKCSLDDFKVSQNSKYGNCFTFNHDPDNVLETTKVGAGYGLKLTLNVGSKEYIGIFGQDPGVKVTVHTPGSTPLPEVDALSAEPGKSTFIGLKRRVVNRQPHPYGNCSLSTENSLLYGGLYTYETCKRSCLQKALIEECGCSDELLAINSTICSTLNETQECCRQRVRKEHDSNKLVCPCFQPCYEESHDVWVSSSSWPSDAYSAYVLEKIHTRSRSKNLPTNIDSIRKNLVRLHLYYQDLNYQEIMDIPSFTIEALLSSIGGLLGLYIGLSLITLCEFCNLIVGMVKVLFKGRKPLSNGGQ
ncbi:uncharacterized protein [Branchiostoma lanceolatum]|uniref:uncharacterized protein n=1 Tax=Branchiostoma lanceolatum TaxID=7740 RepID=UPI0034528E7F